MAGMGRPLLNRRLAEFGTTIFAEMSALAVRTGALNLGQGFPDTDGPRSLLEAASGHIDCPAMFVARTRGLDYSANEKAPLGNQTQPS
jgi:hypothetical protein